MECRNCSTKLNDAIVDLGSQYLTGVFPKIDEPDPVKGNLSLAFCPNCALVQLTDSFDAALMYGSNYGYKSSLNSSMVEHLKSKSKQLSHFLTSPDSVILDIGSNDGTFLNFFTHLNHRLIGIDPTAKYFAQNYDSRISIVSDFFASDIFLSMSSNKKADLITSISMFYDLENPVEFCRNIKNSLTNNGIWHFEQSYAPMMIQNNSFDTICHEHTEYYTLFTIENILKQAGLSVIDVKFNDINGGSIAINATHSESKTPPSAVVEWVRQSETKQGFNDIQVWMNFQKKIKLHKELLIELIETYVSKDYRVWGMGASTKGNVLLQYCQFSTKQIEKIYDINPDKLNKVTPGSRIPIVGYESFRENPPDVALVLPWHFKSNILKKESGFVSNGGTLIFPLPTIQIY